MYYVGCVLRVCMLYVSSSSSSSSSSFNVYHSLVHTKARVRRYQLNVGFNCGTTDCGLNESRMPFRLYCILLFDSVVDSVRIQNHYHGTIKQTGCMLKSPVLSIWLPWSCFSRLLRSCVGTVGLFLLPRPHRAYTQIQTYVHVHKGTHMTY